MSTKYEAPHCSTSSILLLIKICILPCTHILFKINVPHTINSPTGKGAPHSLRTSEIFSLYSWCSFVKHHTLHQLNIVHVVKSLFIPYANSLASCSPQARAHARARTPTHTRARARAHAHTREREEEGVTHTSKSENTSNDDGYLKLYPGSGLINNMLSYKLYKY
jgi:hypothetical protein